MRSGNDRAERAAKTSNWLADDTLKSEIDVVAERFTKSSGNVFLDLGFEPGEASILLIRAELMCDLRTYISSSGLTKAQVAQKLQVSQTRVSDLVDGKWEKFSLEALITLATRAGRKITLGVAA